MDSIVLRPCKGSIRLVTLHILSFESAGIDLSLSVSLGARDIVLPTFEVDPQKRYLRQNETVQFSCQVVSSPPATIGWFRILGRVEEALTTGTPANVQVETHSSNKTVTSLVTVSGIQLRDIAYYGCHAQNTETVTSISKLAFLDVFGRFSGQ